MKLASQKQLILKFIISLQEEKKNRVIKHLAPPQINREKTIKVMEK
ncbi:hypothetical protein MmTuc01_2658 [Methanosarcina mazei Tuc01]|jgi:hypothetical protein|uniref:Uncharacterized protein n=1 Tax=Methanosarcina mazei Tuc01 TaxID=1236903 RepID=M1QCK5_METMZ|nr:hypothetical protein MmTuc01_2658 [Methanosarcina mazei Tuc01]